MKKTIFAIAALPFLLVAPAPASALPSEDLLDLWFLKLLGERGMTTMATNESYVTEVGKMVCTLVSANFSTDYIYDKVSSFMDFGPVDDDIRVPVFTALSMRTFCPPTLKDASWANESWARP